MSMIASLLPGLRELRAPLAAGYAWLVFAYFVAGAPAKVEDAPGPLQELLAVLPTMGTAAIGVAVSFVAYLIGSLSQDLFGRVLPHWVDRLSDAFSHGLDPVDTKMKPDIASAAAAAENLHEVQLQVPEEKRGDDPDQEKKRQRSREHIGKALDGLLPMLNEMRAAGLDEVRAAGLSEAEKPEARRPMLEAEMNLRTAIVPPLVAVMTYVTVDRSRWWAIGLVFAAALFVQAVARRVETRHLAKEHYWARSVEEIRTYLESVVRDLSTGEGIDAGRLRTNLHRLSDRLYPDDSSRQDDDQRSQVGSTDR